MIRISSFANVCRRHGHTYAQTGFQEIATQRIHNPLHSHWTYIKYSVFAYHDLSPLQPRLATCVWRWCRFKRLFGEHKMNIDKMHKNANDGNEGEKKAHKRKRKLKQTEKLPASFNIKHECAWKNGKLVHFSWRNCTHTKRLFYDNWKIHSTQKPKKKPPSSESI